MEWREKTDSAVLCVAICLGCIGSRMANFLFFFTHAGYINIMYVLRPWQTRTHCCGHIVADTKVSPFVRARNICCGHKFCVRNKCFPVCAAQETLRATMCPRLAGPLRLGFHGVRWTRDQPMPGPHSTPPPSQGKGPGNKVDFNALKGV